MSFRNESEIISAPVKIISKPNAMVLFEYTEHTLDLRVLYGSPIFFNTVAMDNDRATNSE